MKGSCRELLYKDLSYIGLVKRSCRELLCRDLGGPGISGDLRKLLYRDLS